MSGVEGARIADTVRRLLDENAGLHAKVEWLERQLSVVKCSECNGRGVIVDPWDEHVDRCPSCTQFDGEVNGS